MESILGLYRILIGVSAATLLLGLVLLSRSMLNQEIYKKQLYILGVVNLLSMLTFLFDINIGNAPGWKEAVILLETTILTTNMIMAFYVHKALMVHHASFPTQIKQLFFFTFVSICCYVTAFFIFGGEKGLLNVENGSFKLVFGLSSVLFLVGSFYPMLASLSPYIKKNGTHKDVRLLLILNGLNNTIGLFFYLLKWPNREVAFMLNIVSNLVFAYYLSYYFLSVFFEMRKKKVLEKEKGNTVYTWKELKTKLVYWEEMKDYLHPFYPDMIEDADEKELSNLEKTHFVLKRLNIKAKDVADALNVSIKAVEMSRYRIRKKLGE